MKNRTWKYSLLLTLFALILATGCKKDDNSPSNKVKDIDGNGYDTITIGTQVWMVENLKVTHYRNGDPIPHVIDSAQWNALATGAYCNYNNDKNNVIPYGRLYNYFAVVDSRNIAPLGWHIPSLIEWNTLENYLGGYSIAGGKLKEADTIHWESPNLGADNSSNFTGLPGGVRIYGGSFGYKGIGCFLWTTTEESEIKAWNGNLSSNSASSGANISGTKSCGFSVRCIKD